MWKPSLTPSTEPRYVTVANALAADVARGHLHAGERLPAQRELARELGVAIGTISRAYELSEERGLVRAEVGRGTFVRGRPGSPEWLRGGGGASGQRVDDVIDLSLYLPLSHLDPPLAPVLHELAGQSDLSTLLEYQPHAGTVHHRATGAHWARRFGVDAHPGNVAVCSGIQHAITVVLSAIAAPGDVVLTERLTYPGLRAVAQLLHLRLVGVDIDGEGIVPESLAEACRQHRPKALYCAPSLHNPTASVSGEARRMAIAEVTEAYDLAIIEDDVARLLIPNSAAPIATLAPDRTYYILDTAKAIAAGLSVAYVVTPLAAFDAISRCICATGWMTPPLMAEIAARWLRDGTAVRIAERKRAEAAVRQRLARGVLGPLTFQAHANSFFIWLLLPDPWSTHEFVRATQRRGVVLRPADAFAVGRDPAPHAVRVCLSATETRDQLEQGLGIIADVLSGSPQPDLALV